MLIPKHIQAKAQESDNHTFLKRKNKEILMT